MKFLLILVVLIGVVFACSERRGSTPVKVTKPGEELFSSARYVCKGWLEKRGHDLSNVSWPDWTVIKNSDGSHSVGARFRNEYHTCVMTNQGDQWTGSIKRMQ